MAIAKGNDMNIVTGIFRGSAFDGKDIPANNFFERMLESIPSSQGRAGSSDEVYSYPKDPKVLRGGDRNYQAYHDKISGELLPYVRRIDTIIREKILDPIQRGIAYSNQNQGTKLSDRWKVAANKTWIQRLLSTDPVSDSISKAQKNGQQLNAIWFSKVFCEIGLEGSNKATEFLTGAVIPGQVEAPGLDNNLDRQGVSDLIGLMFRQIMELEAIYNSRHKDQSFDGWKHGNKSNLDALNQTLSEIENPHSIVSKENNVGIEATAKL